MLSRQSESRWICRQTGRSPQRVFEWSGSPEDTDLERISLRGPRIKHLRDLFVIESGAQTRSRTLFVLSACEYRGCLTQQRVSPAYVCVLAGTRRYTVLRLRAHCGTPSATP
jgi:hypothetical protein